MGHISHRHKIMLESHWEEMRDLCLHPMTHLGFHFASRRKHFPLLLRFTPGNEKREYSIRPHCWRYLKYQPTAGPILTYCSKRLRPTFKPDSVASNFHFTENTLPTRRDDSRCVTCIGDRKHWHIPPPGNSYIWQMTGPLSQLVWWRSVHYCSVMRTSVFEIFTGRKLKYPARLEKRTVRFRNWLSNMLLLTDQSQNSLYCSKIEARPVDISLAVVLIHIPLTA
jgi:hypothetical protein